jgi:hypothetical protein
MKNEQKVILDKIKCRNIVKEILDFGVTQEQIKNIINLLALELDDRDLMLKINSMFSKDIEVEDKPQITL